MRNWDFKVKENCQHHRGMYICARNWKKKYKISYGSYFFKNSTELFIVVRWNVAKNKKSFM